MKITPMGCAITAGLTILSPLRGDAATPSVPTVSALVSGPGVMYPNPAVSVVPTAPRSKTFPTSRRNTSSREPRPDAPYQTRIIVRRPKDPKAFSGTVVAEAQHAGGRSLIFEWSRVSVLTRHHLFVEIVHSPANVATMKTFNAERYAPLNIVMGQANEIIAQVGRLVKAKAGPFAAYDVKRITLMGTSASSATVRTYLAAHADLRMPDGKPIYDGFLLTSTLGNTPLPVVDVPMIQMPTQTEVATYAQQGNKYRRPDSDEPGNRFRLYEVAGMPHNNARDRPEFQTDPCTLPVTDFHAGAFTALGLNHLIEWIANGKTPPHAPPIAVDQEHRGRQLAARARREWKRQGRRSQRLGRRADRDLRRHGEGEDAGSGPSLSARRDRGPAARGDAEIALSQQGRLRIEGREAAERARQGGLVPAGVRRGDQGRRERDENPLKRAHRTQRTDYFTYQWAESEARRPPSSNALNGDFSQWYPTSALTDSRGAPANVTSAPPKVFRPNAVSSTDIPGTASLNVDRVMSIPLPTYGRSHTLLPTMLGNA